MKALLWLFVFLLAACASPGERQAAYSAKMDEWIGRHVDDLARAFGPPTSSHTLTTGGKILRYEKSETRTTGGGSSTVYTPVHTSGGIVNVPQQRVKPVRTSTHSCVMQFEISPANVVETWKSEGNACY